MDKKIIDLLFAILRSAITDKPMTENEKALFSAEMLPALMEPSTKHDLEHLVGWGICRNELLDKNSREYVSLQHLQVKALFRYEDLNREFEQLCSALETAGIPFIPLKGSVMRRYYPLPWMRTSCDIDVLVHEENADRAADMLVKQLGYHRAETLSHDIPLYSPAGQHIELHFKLVEEGRANSASDILVDVWNNSVLKDGKKYWREMTDEMFYFYHIAHMAKHFVNGGCGVRTFMDLWILDQIDCDPAARRLLIEKGGLTQFAETAGKLGRCWMEDAAHDILTQQMEDFILLGGVYGTLQTRVLIHQQKQGGRLKYALSKIFPPYDVLKTHYPILLKYRWLTPVMVVRRWFKLVFCGYAKISIKILKHNYSVSTDELSAMRQFLENIGL